MTYSNFVDTLSNGFSMFYSGLITLANSLINNYLIITIGVYFYLICFFINRIHIIEKLILIT